jgi:hypothetical protein
MTHISIQPWQVAEQDFPRTGNATDQLQFLLNYAVLAPSGHNTQPWRFTIQNETLELWADLTRALPKVDPHYRELIISCGAALLNLRLAIHHFGYGGDIQRLPDPQQPDLLARIRLGDWAEASAEERSLFDAIPHRHTDRHPFEVWDVPESVLKWLQHIALEEGAWLYLVEGEMARSHLLGLVNVADHLQMADPDIRQELATWMHSGSDPRSDGLPAYALGMPPRFDFLTVVLSWLTRHFNLGDRIAQQDEKLLRCASAIAILGTNGDTPEDWLKAGQALQKILLRAQSLGIVASFFNAPIQMPEVRSQLQQNLERVGYPQVVLRLGYRSSVQPTPRRKNEDVLF